jgi:signal transduction histidine kinase/ActR/RegA family two-component response regulator
MRSAKGREGGERSVDSLARPTARDVSCRVVGTVLEDLHERGVRLETVTAGLPYSPEHLQSKYEWIDWLTFRTLMARAGESLTDEDLIAIADRFPDSIWGRAFGFIAGAIFSPIALYRWIVHPERGPITQIVTCMDHSLEQIGPNRVLITVTMRPGYPPSHEFLVGGQGFFSSFPRFLGLESARVEMEETDTGARYYVEMPSACVLRARIRRAVFWPFSLRGAVEELRESTEVLQRLNRELQLENAERRRAEERLRGARAEALDAARVKTEFLANMSHEIRTPMSGIIGAISLLEQTELTAEQREFVELAQSSANAQLAVINDILDLSKIEAGKMTVEARPFQLRDAIGEVMALLSLEAEKKHIGLDWHCEASIPALLIGDVGRIRQVVMNLAANAIKFTLAGRVTIRAERIGNSGDVAEVSVSVEDTGIGIPEDKLQDIFDDFTQVDTSASRRHGGTGLGLTICRHLVTLMGGTIGVESRVGEGSRFWFQLPLPLPVSQAEGRTATETAGDASSAPQPVRHQVLLVEDNDISRRVTRQMLERLGCEVTLATNGREALQRLQNRPYDLVLMDCQMPEFDGYAATVEIRRREGSTAHVPIVAITADTMKEDRDRCIAAGMDDYVGKPASFGDLEAILRRWGARAPEDEAPRARAST